MPLTVSEGIALIVALCLALYGALYRRKPTNHKLPPGPPGLPLLGNLHQLPAKRPHPKLLEWARQYGEIYHIRLGFQDMIVLNSPEAANELFVNRGRKYSSRAAPYVAHEILSDGQRILMLPYSKEFKASRKSIQSAIGAGPARRLRVYQDLESRATLKDLIDHGDKSFRLPISRSPAGELNVPDEHWFSLIRRYTTSLVLNVTYGQRVYKMEGHPVLYKIYQVLETFTHVGQPGEFLADVFPILRNLPDCLAPWRVRVRKLHEREMSVWGTLFDAQKAAWKTGTSPECLVSSYLTQRAEKGHEDAPGRGITEDGWMRDKLLTYTAATVLEAGSDTTASTLQAFVLFMLAHPHVLRKARDEIDRVVGPERLPSFDDEPRLPYLVACLKETMRTRPIAPLGMTHMATEDDVYNGYFIPKGSAILGNIWAIHMDPMRYPNPTVFDPERFYEPNKPTRMGSGSGQDSDRDHYTFGWGRRFCPGSTFAEQSLFIVGSRLIWGLDFYPMKDETGKLIVPDFTAEMETWSDGFISSPCVFHVGWKARDRHRAEIIAKAYEEAQGEWETRNLHPDER